MHLPCRRAEGDRTSLTAGGLDANPKAGFAKPYGQKAALPAADQLNGRLIAFCDERGPRVDRVPIDACDDFCGVHAPRHTRAMSSLLHPNATDASTFP